MFVLMICLGTYCNYLDMPSLSVCEREKTRIEREDDRNITELMCLDRHPSEDRH
jgi:hypothetical protein